MKKTSYNQRQIIAGIARHIKKVDIKLLVILSLTFIVFPFNGFSQITQKDDSWETSYNFVNLIFGFNTETKTRIGETKYSSLNGSTFKVYGIIKEGVDSICIVTVNPAKDATPKAGDQTINNLTKEATLYCVKVSDLKFYAKLSKRKKDNSGMFDTETWLDDDLTVGFGNTNLIGAGIRFIFEPQLGVPIPLGNNQFVVTQFSSLPKFGLETNLLKGYVSLQGLFFFPSQISFDAQSPIVVQNIIPSTHQVNTKASWGAGLSFLDGIFAVGYGKLYLDGRDFDMTNANFRQSQTRVGFWYINIQAVSAVRKAIKSNN